MEDWLNLEGKTIQIPSFEDICKAYGLSTFDDTVELPDGTRINKSSRMYGRTLYVEYNSGFGIGDNFLCLKDTDGRWLCRLSLLWYLLHAKEILDEQEASSYDLVSNDDYLDVLLGG